MIETRPMKPRLLRLALIAALLAGMDAHLALIQGCAWATMAWRASRGVSVSRALSETFDGRHPCAVCFAVKKTASAPSLNAAAPARVDMIGRTVLSVPASASARDLPPARPLPPDSAVPETFSPPPKTLLA